MIMGLQSQTESSKANKSVLVFYSKKHLLAKSNVAFVF